jgi:hypothetical protein
MRTVAVLALASFACLASSVLAQLAGEKSGINKALGVSPSTADFVKQVALTEQEKSGLERTVDAEQLKAHPKLCSEPGRLGSIFSIVPAEPRGNRTDSSDGQWVWVGSVHSIRND